MQCSCGHLLPTYVRLVLGALHLTSSPTGCELVRQGSHLSALGLPIESLYPRFPGKATVRYTTRHVSNSNPTGRHNMYSRRACRTLNVGMSGRAPLDGEVPGTLASRALWQQNHPIGSRRFPTLPSTVLLSTGKSSGLLAESAVNRRHILQRGPTRSAVPQMGRDRASSKTLGPEILSGRGVQNLGFNCSRA